MPVLQILAGCNGSGKSYYSDFFVQSGLLKTQPVNIDALEAFIDTTTIPDDPLRYPKILKKEIDHIFHQLCKAAISQRKDFAYECNLRLDQLKYVSIFEKEGYSIQLIYLWLDNIECSTERVKIRVNEGGHAVSKESIHQNFTEGINNLDLSVSEFNWDHVLLIDNTKEAKSKGETLYLLLEMEHTNILQLSKNFFNKERSQLLPHISNMIASQTNSHIPKGS